MTPRVRGPSSGSRAALATATRPSAASTALAAWARRRSPTSVGTTHLLVRSNTSTPSSSSSLRIWPLRVGWLTLQASAARPKCRCSATANR